MRTLIAGAVVALLLSSGVARAEEVSISYAQTVERAMRVAPVLALIKGDGR